MLLEEKNKSKILIKKTNKSIRIAFFDNSENLIFYEEDFLVNQEYIGNIYIGKVVEIKAHLKAVLVDYGESKLGFLSFYSINPYYFNISNEEKNKIISELKYETILKNNSVYNKYKIDKVIKIGQKMVLQICRKQKDYKSAMLSTFLTFGHEITYIPNSLNQLFLGDDKYKNIVQEIAKKKEINGSFNFKKIRNMSEEEFEKKILNLIDNWEKIGKKLFESEKVGLVYINNDFLQKLEINPLFDKIQNIYCEDLILKIQGKNVYYGKYIFKKHELEISKLFFRTIQLKSGANIIFDLNSTAITIDVNTGKSRLSHLEINIEAMEEIIKQIYLRNLAGMFVIDFLDIQNAKFEQLFFDMMQKSKEIYGNKAQFQLEYSKLNVLILQRQHIGNFSTEQLINPTNGYFTIEKLCEIIMQELNYKFQYNNELILSTSEKIIEYLINNYRYELFSFEESGQILKIERVFFDKIYDEYFEILITNNNNFLNI